MGSELESMQNILSSLDLKIELSVTEGLSLVIAKA